jgi:hypothetical protein
MGDAGSAFDLANGDRPVRRRGERWWPRTLPLVCAIRAAELRRDAEVDAGGREQPEAAAAAVEFLGLST